MAAIKWCMITLFVDIVICVACSCYSFCYMAMATAFTRAQMHSQLMSRFYGQQNACAPAKHTVRRYENVLFLRKVDFSRWLFPLHLSL